ELLRATSGTTQMTDDYQRTLSARRNLEALRPLVEHCPRQINVYTMLGANEQMIGRPAEAVESYRQALAISPRPEVYMEIGNLLVELGRIDEAVDALVAAARYDQLYLNSIQDPEVLRLVETKMLEQDSAQTR
ncbi:MAG TPA: tetratricopeptide repeat protein, partial [Thermoanaerobaculia bacterium]|nr:tetratricopeptide repeat protein [Thermoanaerobaculia bacterium]